MTKFSRTLLSTAVLTAITMGSAIAGDAPKVPGFQFGVSGSSWDLTAGNAMDATKVDIQTNNQGPGSPNLSGIVDQVKLITIDTDGRTSDHTYNGGFDLEKGKSLTVTGSAGKTNAILVLKSGGFNLSSDIEDRKLNVDLTDSTFNGLTIYHGAILRSDQNTKPSTTNTNTVSLTSSTLNGDITLKDDSYFEKYPEDEWFDFGSKRYYLHYLEGNVNTVSLVHSTWVGNLTSTSKIEGIKNKNTITLDGSNWTGHVADNADDTTINLKNGTVWTVTSADAAAARVVSASNNDRIEKLTSDAASKVVLQKDSKLDVVNATGDLNLHFMSLENTAAKFDKLEAKTTLIADGSLNDGKQSAQALADQMKDNVTAQNSSDAKLQWSVAEGLMTNGANGVYNAQGNAVTTQTSTNSNLQTIAETTAITMMQWRAEADDLQQRMGELRQSANANGVWVRTFGGKSEANVADFEFNGFQFGYDHQVSPMQFVGGALSYTKGDGTFAKGSSDAESIGIAAYSTWMKDNGAYIDVIAKAGKLTNDFDINAGTLGKLAGKYSTQALALTVESGHRFPVAHVFYVEPQVAFTASHIFGENYGAGQGVTVEQDSINSYVARAGLAAGIQCPDNKGSAWVRASYLYDFDGETKTTGVKGVANTFTQDFGGGWYELGIGGSLNFTKNLHGYADFEYVAGSPIDTPYKWNLGVRYTY